MNFFVIFLHHSIEAYFFSRNLFEKKMGHEIEGDFLGDEFKGYIFKITGGNDKQGFSMKQGVLVNGRVRLLMKAGKIIIQSLCF